MVSKVWLLGLSEQSILCKPPSFGHYHIGNGALNSRFSKAKPLAALITAKGREALQSTINAPRSIGGFSSHVDRGVASVPLDDDDEDDDVSHRNLGHTPSLDNAISYGTEIPPG